jgi:hypothetical protein
LIAPELAKILYGKPIGMMISNHIKNALLSQPKIQTSMVLAQK